MGTFPAKPSYHHHLDIFAGLRSANTARLFNDRADVTVHWAQSRVTWQIKLFRPHQGISDEGSSLCVDSDLCLLSCPNSQTSSSYYHFKCIGTFRSFTFWSKTVVKKLLHMLGKREEKAHVPHFTL